MPMYMDIHEVPGATAEDVAKAHSADMERQKKHGVKLRQDILPVHCAERGGGSQGAS